ncbi:hypothetical protein M0Q50_01035 [bacterium]|jgi:hypothetical protein|nr:hypothetical protein [bacterium]
MINYNYELSNFVATPSENDVTIKIFDKNGSLMYSINPNLCYFYYKNNLIIIKSDNNEDITLDFKDTETSIQALSKLNDAKKIIVEKANSTSEYFTKSEILVDGVLDSRYYTTGQTNNILENYLTSSYTANFNDLSGLTFNNLLNGEVLTYIDGVWTNSAFTFDTSAFTSNYYTIEELNSSASTATINFNKIINKPTTLIGYGITDVYSTGDTYTKDELNGNKWNGTDAVLDTRYYTRSWIDTHFYDINTMNAILSGGTIGGGSGGITIITDISGVTSYSKTYPVNGIITVLNSIGEEVLCDKSYSDDGLTINIDFDGNLFNGRIIFIGTTNSTEQSWSTGETIDYINNNYYNKTYINNNYSNTAHTHSLSGLTDINLSSVSNYDLLMYYNGEWVNSEYNIDLTDYYTKSELYNTGQTYTKTETNNLILSHTILTGITNPHKISFFDLESTAHTHDIYVTKEDLSGGTIDSRYYTKEELNGDKWLGSDAVLDIRYYTRTWIDNHYNDISATTIFINDILLNYYTSAQTSSYLQNKSNINHTHILSGLTDTNIFNQTDNQFLVYSGGTWINKTISYASSNDLNNYYTKTELNDGSLNNKYISLSGSSNISGSLIPSISGLSLGSETNPWSELWVSQNTIYIGGIPISISENGELIVSGQTIATTSGTSEMYSLTSHTHNNFYTKNEVYTSGETNNLLIDYYTSIQTNNLLIDYYTSGQTNNLLIDYYTSGQTLSLINDKLIDYSLTSHTHNYVLDDMNDVDIWSILEGQFLLYSGGTWTNKTIDYLKSSDLNNYYTKTELNNGIYDNRYIRLSGSSGITGSLVPATVGLSLGSISKPWSELYLSQSTMYIDGVSVSIIGGQLIVSGKTIPFTSEVSNTAHTHDNRYYTKTQLLPTTISSPWGQGDAELDARYYTRSWIDTHFYDINIINILLSGLTNGGNNGSGGITIITEISGATSYSKTYPVNGIVTVLNSNGEEVLCDKSYSNDGLTINLDFDGNLFNGRVIFIAQLQIVVLHNLGQQEKQSII